jgi:hypothetical protein
MFRDKDSRKVKCYTMTLPIVGLCDSPFSGRPYFLLTSGELGRILGVGDGFCSYAGWKWKLGDVLGFEPVEELK